MNFVSGIERHMECQFLFGCTHLEIHCLLPNPHCSTSREAELDPAGALEELDPDGGARPQGSSTCQSWRGELDPARRPGGTRPRWRSPAMGELDSPVMEERAAMTARTGWGRARSHPGHGGARPRMEEPDPGGNRPRRPWESSNLEPTGLGGASFHDRLRQIGRSSVPARPWGA